MKMKCMCLKGFVVTVMLISLALVQAAPIQAMEKALPESSSPLPRSLQNAGGDNVVMPSKSKPSSHVDRTDRLIVKYKDASMARSATIGSVHIRALSERAGVALTHVRAMSGDNHVFKLPKRMTLDETQAIARKLSADPGVEYAVPDRLMFPMQVPNDPSYEDQWHYKSPPPASDDSIAGINLPPAWDITTGSSSLVVGVIDTGIVNHADLQGRIVPGYNFISNSFMAGNGIGRSADAGDLGDWVSAAESTDPTSIFYGCPVESSSWHGTHVAGTIGATSNNGIGVAGINWNSKILPVRVLGKCGGFLSDVMDGMRWAAGLPVQGVPSNANPARVINMSLTGNWACDAVMQSAVNDVLAAGTVVVVAAGNSRDDVANYTPAGCNGVISVAAVNRSAAPALYTNYGQTVKIAAPGGEQYSTVDPNGVLSTLNAGTTSPIASPGGDTYGYYQGTSMATPHVTGVVSLMLSSNPTLTPPQVLQLLQATARPFPRTWSYIGDCATSICGAGIVDAYKTIQAVSSNAPIIGANPLYLNFTTHPGDPNPPSQSITIINPGGGKLNWSVSSNTAWLHVTPTNGQESGIVTVSIDNTSFSTSSTYTGSIMISADGVANSPVTIPVTFNYQLMPHAPLPLGVMDHAQAAVGGKVYQIGGVGIYKENLGKLVQIYDTASDSWTTGTPKPTPAWSTNAAVIDGKIYFPGGVNPLTYEILSTLEIYDTATDQWSSGAPLPVPSSCAGVEAVNGKLYVIGGMDNTNTIYPHPHTYVYDPTTNSWDRLADMSTARFCAGSGVINGKIYTFGGRDGRQAITNSAEVYDPVTNIWSPIRTMNVPRVYFGGTAFAGKLFAFGGDSYGNIQRESQDAEVYDPGTDTWVVTPLLLSKRSSRQKATAVGNSIYVMGGMYIISAGFFDYLYINESYTPFTDPHQIITFSVAPNVVVGGTGTLNASTTSGLAVTYGSSTPIACSISGNTVTGLIAGTNNCTITADQAGNSNYNAASQVTQTFSIGKGSQTIIFGAAPIMVPNGTGTIRASATSGLPVTFGSATPTACSISGNIVTGLVAGANNCTITADQAGNSNYNAASQVTQTFSIGKGSQSITFGVAPSVTYGGAGTVHASATSGLPVIFSSATRTACDFISGGNMILGGLAGTNNCTIIANQAGDATYNAAPQATLTISIGKGSQTITFGATPSVTVGGTGTVSASAHVFSITFGSATPTACSVSDNIVTGLVAGTNNCTITADQAGNSNYYAALQVTQTLSIGKGSQTITFGAAPRVFVYGTSIVSASATSGLAVTFGSSTPTACTVSGNVVTGLVAGTNNCTITADQAGDANYKAAVQASQTISIGRGSQTITFGAAPSVVFGGTGTVKATGGASGYALSFGSSTPTACTVSGNVVTGLVAGTNNCTITADQAGDANYKAAVQASQTISIGRGSQTITFGAAPSVVFGGTGTVSATGGASGYALSFGSSTPTVCTVTGNIVTGLLAGTNNCTLTADQVGNDNYNAATQAMQTISIRKASQTIAFGAVPSVTVGGTGMVSATGGTSGNAVNYGSSTPTACTISGNMVTGLIAGTNNCIITADQAGNANYNAAAQASQPISIDGSHPYITSFSMPPLSKVLTIPVTTFTVSDTNKITGYAITLTSTPPAIWHTAKPATFTVNSAGSKILYAWVKDSAGNVSASASSTVNIDLTKPVIDTFTVTTLVNSLTIPVIAFSATDDNSGIAGYLITSTATAPLPNATGWSNNAPTSYTATSAGTKILYAWAKDAAGNVSLAKRVTAVIDMTAPVVWAFFLPTVPVKSLTLPVIVLIATDNIAVGAYLITESSTAPAADDDNWKPTKPTSYTFASDTVDGLKTLYAWAKDTAGNVSLAKSATVTIDTAAPVITGFAVPSLSKTLTIPVTTFTTSDTNKITGYAITLSNTPPTTWRATKPATFRVTSAGSKTLYAWAKDSAGNISLAKSATVTIQP
jgi:subtilisin family serine protease